ncbi:MAG TPA: rhamnulokinase family protein [Verrucomicrobiae bacterium]|nr:rhamnulokinase family protein [Verrucomicrobiae bacterium]
MSAKKICLAVDLGASSGRVVAGIFDGAKLELAELNRFSNEPVKLTDGWHWNFEKLFGDIKNGISLAVKKYGDAVVSVGVDTWGVDYGLLDANGKLLAAPFQYRDARTNGMMERAFHAMPRAEIYRRTGIQFMFFNTLFQLLAEKDLSRAEQLLFMPDLIHYFLTGVAANEKTIASTSQLLNPHTQNWENEIIRVMRFPEKIFGRLIDAGTEIGGLLPEIVRETGARNLRVITPAGHDTASAVVGVPAEENEPVFLSSGTWSLMGRELKSPIISEKSLAAAFSNEGGVFGTTRFLKNIAGMWLLQECKRAWDANKENAGYDQLIEHTKTSAAFTTFIDSDAADFQTPANMPDAIAEFCRRTKQAIPADSGAFTRVILESLAMKYRSVKDSLAQLTGKSVEKIYVVGGGAQNHLLNQFTADALDCAVVAGPVEATSIGNIIMQLYALGGISSLTEGRALTRRSFETKIFEPQNPDAWDDAYTRFQKIALTDSL